jgi:hypothetical protein
MYLSIILNFVIVVITLNRIRHAEDPERTPTEPLHRPHIDLTST